MINKDELLFVVDENNRPIEPRKREEVHSRGYWHRNSHVWITNSNNQVLCQKRSMNKDSNPGFWEAFFGGHLEPNEDYLEGAVKEINEELDFGVTKKDLIPFKVVKSEIAKEFISVYRLNWGGNISEINFEREEIDLLKWVDFPKLKEFLLDRKEPNWTELGYEKEVLQWLESV